MDMLVLLLFPHAGLSMLNKGKGIFMCHLFCVKYHHNYREQLAILQLLSASYATPVVLCVTMLQIKCESEIIKWKWKMETQEWQDNRFDTCTESY